MTEEITYADLEFNKLHVLENIRKPADPEKKGLPSYSSTWRLAAVTFLTLCLALIVGLLAVGIVFFQVSGELHKEIGNLKKNQETLKTNFSKKLQNLKDKLCLIGKEKNMSNEVVPETEMVLDSMKAIPAFRNLNTHINAWFPGPSCTLCPANWQWMGADTCFYISTQKRSWEESKKFCSLQNSTLVMLKERDKLIHIGQYFLKEPYWIGLSSNNERTSWIWEDNTDFYTSDNRIPFYYISYPCAYLTDKYIYANHRCNENNFWICEKAPIQLRFTDM